MSSIIRSNPIVQCHCVFPLTITQPLLRFDWRHGRSERRNQSQSNTSFTYLGVTNHRFQRRLPLSSQPFPSIPFNLPLIFSSFSSSSFFSRFIRPPDRFIHSPKTKINSVTVTWIFFLFLSPASPFDSDSSATFAFFPPPFLFFSFRFGTSSSRHRFAQYTRYTAFTRLLHLLADTLKFHNHQVAVVLWVRHALCTSGQALDRSKHRPEVRSICDA